MAKKTKARTFDEVLAELANQRFDVAGAPEGASRARGARRVSKYGCAAEIAGSKEGTAMMVSRPGWVMGGEISRIVDKGYQKFMKSSKVEIVATAAILRAVHEFSLELDAATGEMALYNEALGTTSDVYLYDRVAGRPDVG